MVLMIVVSGGLFAQSLKEKQALAAQDFSSSEKNIKNDCGFDVKITVDAASFTGDIDAIYYLDSRGAQRVGNAISKICYNDLGKEAMKGKKITKIVLKNTKSGKKWTIAGGVFTLSQTFNGNDYYGESDLQTEIENSL